MENNQENKKGRTFKLDLSKVTPEYEKHLGTCMDVSYHLQGGLPYIYYGVDNFLPYYLSDLANYSPTHSGMIEFKSTLIAGNGFVFDKENTKLAEVIENMDLNEVLTDVALEYAIFQGYALEVVYNSNKKIKSIVSSTIPAIRKENSENPTQYYLSKDWRRLYEQGFEYTNVPIYNPETALEDGKQILYEFKRYPNNWFYPKESYRSGLIFIELEKNMGRLWNSSVKQGFRPAGILVIQEDVEEDEAKDFKKNLSNQHQGPDTAGDVLCIIRKGEPPLWIPFKGESDSDVYNVLNQITEQKILTSHNSSSPQLAGIPAQGGMSSSNELSTAFEYFQNTIIKKYQNAILKGFCKLFKQMGVIKSNDEIKIAQLNPLQFRFSETVLLNTLKRYQILEAMGYPKAGDATDDEIPFNKPLQLNKNTNTNPDGIDPSNVAPMSNPANVVTTPNSQSNTKK